MTAQLPAAIKSLRAELGRNPRLKAGLALIGLLLIILAWLELAHWRQASVQELQSAQARAAKLDALTSQTDWRARAEEASSLLATLEGEIPSTTSPGLAQAAFQSRTSNLLGPDLSRLQVTLAPLIYIDTAPGLAKVSATIMGSMPIRRALDLVAAVERERHLTVVSALHIRTGRTSTFSMTIDGYYWIKGVSDTSESTP